MEWKKPKKPPTEIQELLNFIEEWHKRSQKRLKDLRKEFQKRGSNGTHHNFLS